MLSVPLLAFIPIPGIGGAPLSEPSPLLPKPGRGGAPVRDDIPPIGLVTPGGKISQLVINRFKEKVKPLFQDFRLAVIEHSIKQDSQLKTNYKVDEEHPCTIHVHSRLHMNYLLYSVQSKYIYYRHNSID